jgi:hypothetical protein
MSYLSFQVEAASEDLRRLDLPVEVRKHNLAMVAQAPLSGSVELAPGDYHVTITLPGGSKLYAAVTMGETPETAFLRPSSQENTAELGREQVEFLGRDEPARSGVGGAVLRGELPGYETSVIRLFSGNAFSAGGYRLLEEAEWVDRHFSPSAGVYELWVRLHQPALLQLLQPFRRPVNVALPIAGQVGCRVLIKSGAAVRPGSNLSVMLFGEASAESANMMLAYQETGRLDQAAAALGSGEVADSIHDVGMVNDAEIAELMLLGKLRNPMAAVIGAYVLLRLGELERLHEWTRNLMNWFPWLPDGLVIRAEHQARRGRHREALEHLLALPERGLPLFGDGLVHAANRLRLYRSHFAKSGDAAGKTEEIDQLLDRLQGYSTYVNFRKPVTTFTGLNPTQPDDRLLEGSPDDFAGLRPRAG